MPTIRKRSRHRNGRTIEQWQVMVRLTGYPPRSRMFPHGTDKRDAYEWGLEEERKLKLGDVPTLQRKTWQHITISHLIEDYLKAYPSLNYNNVVSLRQFSRESICSKSLPDFTKQDVHRFVERKLQESWKPPGAKGEAKPLSPRTVRRQLNIIQRVFQHAIDFREGYASLPNHFRGIRIVGSTGGRRERALEDGELEKILEACKHCLEPNRYFVPLAIHLAIDTGLRRQEIFNLMWSDIDDNNWRIRIRKSKTDKATGNVGATIVLPAKAKALLLTLAAVVVNEQTGDEWTFPHIDEPIFPMSGKAFSQAWSDVLNRAGIENLHFHDLRRTANTRFIQAGLTVEERNIMLRHADKSMQAVYIGRNHLLKGIQDKLDRFVLNGLRLDEALDKGVVDFGEMTVPMRNKQKGGLVPTSCL
jgi:integrase